MTDSATPSVPKSAKPLGAYSPVRIIPIGTTKLVFISGLTAGGEAPEDIAGQTEIVFARMKELLAEAGGDFSHLAKITTFLTDMHDYDAYNKIRNRIFGEMAAPPASATVGTTQLVRPHLKIEIESIAIVSAPQ